MNLVETPLEQAIRLVGGPRSAASICNKTVQAIGKWLKRNALPRTEYSGETSYAERLAAHSDGQFTAEWLLENAKPTPGAAHSTSSTEAA